MPQATATPATPSGAAPITRRVTVGAFLALAGARDATAIPMPAPDPDAALHAAVAAFKAADDAVALDNLHGDDDDTTDAVGERWSDLLKVLITSEPHTVPGLIAKTQAAAVALRRCLDGCAADPEAVLAQSVVLATLRLMGAEPWPLHPAEVELQQRWAARCAGVEGGAA